jgi:hypothetical protein
VVILSDRARSARVVVAPQYQGRVMTSTAAGDHGASFGYIHRENIEKGERTPHITVFGGEDRFFHTQQLPQMAGPMTGVAGVAGMPMVRQMRFNFPDEFGGLELASITPKLGAYFGATDGVLVVQAPENDALKLEDGDVIQTIDGRKPDDGAHALRILRSYSSGEKLNLKVLRQRKPLSLVVTMPDRPQMQDFFDAMPPPPAPPAPAAPPAPPGPGGNGTDE